MKNTYELYFSHYCFFGVEGGIFFSLFFYKIDFKSNRPFFLDFVFQPVELGEPFYLKLTSHFSHISPLPSVSSLFLCLVASQITSFLSRQ
jgi:hypothetical protein